MQFAAAAEPFLNRTRLRHRCWCRRHPGSHPEFLHLWPRNVDTEPRKSAVISPNLMRIDRATWTS